MSAPGPHRRRYASNDDFPAADLAASWEASAAGFIAWAHKPLHDSYWHHHRDQFLELVPPPGRLTLDSVPATSTASNVTGSP